MKPKNFITFVMNFKILTKMQVTLITTEGDIKKVNIKPFKDAKHFVSKDFYESPIEVLTMSDGRLMLLDEEGKIKKLEYKECSRCFG